MFIVSHIYVLFHLFYERINSLPISEWNCSSFLTSQYQATSSANILELHFNAFGRSLIKRKKRKCSKTPPCGTPEVTSIQFEKTPFTNRTPCFLPERKAEINATTLLYIPKCIIYQSFWWEMALSKSIKYHPLQYPHPEKLESH